MTDKMKQNQFKIENITAVFGVGFISLSEMNIKK